MMLFLATLYSVRQFNLARYFLQSDGNDYDDLGNDEKTGIIDQVS